MSYEKPFEGIRVLDISQGIAGPYCAMMLAQHGADVVKVEPPKGDWIRGLGKSFGEFSAYAVSANVGKRSLALDLKNPEGLAIVLDLARQADVVMESSRPGVAARLGIGYDDIQAVNPRAIYASISGFGQQGPYRERPVTDTIAQAFSGIMSSNPGVDGIPHKIGITVVDAVTAMLSYGAVASAIHGRGDGPGTYLDLSLMQSAAALQTPKVIEWAVEEGSPRMLNSPAGSYRTRDGWIAITVVTDEHYARICRAMSLEHLVDDPAFADFDVRAENHDQLVDLLNARFAELDTEEWLERFRAEDALANRIYDYGDWLEDPQVRAAGAAPPVSVPGFGELPMPLIPGRREHLGSPPRIGEHTREVLGELGHDADEIDRLIASGAVRAM